MSQFFDQASLVMVPSGYKTGKVYSQKPLSADGELTFTRASNASRVNADGLIEKVRTNVALYSEQFDNAAWTKNRSSITTNALTNPVNGATTADYIVEDTANGTHEVVQIFTVSSGVSYTFSTYAKSDTRTKISLVLAGAAFVNGGNGQAIFNLANGTVVSAISGATASIVSAGNGFYRCSITKASTSTVGVVALQLVDALDSTTYTGDGSSRAAFFGAQFEVSDFGATDYIPTTTSARSTFAGITVDGTSVPNVPRLDYSGGASCGKLLLEPQRTNKQTSSESINSVDYAYNAQISISSNFSTSPDGYQNADKIIATTANNYHAVRTGKATPNGYDVVSCFVKASGYNYVQLTSWADPSDYVNFDLTDGTLGTVSVATVYGIESYGEGWYRIWANVQASGGGIVGIQIVTSKTAGWSQSFAGNGTDGVLLWGVQIEASANYPSSYIPTLGSAVTRLADSAYKTGISSLIGQTEGTLFADFIMPPAGTLFTHYRISGTGGLYNNSQNITLTATNQIRGYSFSGSVEQAQINSGVYAEGTRVKVAYAYKANDFVLYVNGVLIGTDTSGTVPAMSEFLLGSYYPDTSINVLNRTNQALLFKTRLTNAQLAELTTL